MSTPTLAPAECVRPTAVRRVTVAQAVVGVLVLWAALDVGLRFLPLTWFDIMDADIARRWHTKDAPFAPNVRVESSYYVGDEALVGNLRPTETRPLRTFTTDEHGFRWTPPVRPGEPPQTVVVRGFSYSWGALMDDHETFPYELAKNLGENVYCAARYHEDAEQPADVLRLMEKLGAQPRVAVYVHLEPNGHEPSWNAPTAMDRLGEAALGERYESVGQTLRWLRVAGPAWIALSPLTAIATRASRAVHDGRILANPAAGAVVSFPLPDGSRMLNRAGDVARVLHPPDDATVAARAEFIEEWSAGLARGGMTTVVALVPEKMSVYGPEFGLNLAADPYLNRLERELRRRGVRTVNLLPMLRAGAVRDLATGNLAYFREDHHWSPEGVRRMAKTTASAIQEIGLLEPHHVEQAENAR